MLARPASEHGFEVFMVRRSEASHFMPDAFVFPGGTLDPGDLTPQIFERTRGVEPGTLVQQFRAQAAPDLPVPFASPDPTDAAGLLVAGIRELFEEAGVLLACDNAGHPVSNAALAPHRKRLAFARTAVQSGELAFSDVLRELDVYADAGALALFSHWITPPVFPRRYNTHFFLAIAPAGEVALADAHETHDGIWISPREALRECERDRLRMVYPTIKHMERLAAFENADDLMAFARTKVIYSVMPDTPADREFSLPARLESAW